MKNALDYILGLVGLVALAVAVWQFYLFVTSPGTTGKTEHLWYAIGGFVVLCVCALGIFLRHVNKEEEIHITQ